MSMRCTGRDVVLLALILGHLGIGNADQTGTLGGSKMFEEYGKRSLKQELVARIAEGTSAECGRYPYIASLRDRLNLHRCGGVLVDPRWILTAAHCVDRNSAQALPAPIVVIGACNLDDGENENGIVEIFVTKETIIHGNWTGAVLDGNDIALLMLDGESSHTPISLPEERDIIRSGESLSVLGWGVTGDGLLPQDLQEADAIQFVDNKSCKDESVWGSIIQSSMVCALGSTSNQGICRGDTGGPLLLDLSPKVNTASGAPTIFDIVVGIASFAEGRDCGGPDTKPDVYTRVISFRDWIDAQMKGGFDEEPVESVEPRTSAIQQVECPQASPLHLATQDGNVSNVQDILDNGTDVDGRRGCDGSTALLLASVAGNQEIVVVLIDAGARVDIPNDNGLTPLMGASANAHLAVVVSLLGASADPNKRQQDGNTALGLAVMEVGESSLNIIENLTAAGADVDGRGVKDRTPLAIAAFYGNIGGVEFLIEKDANKSIADTEGKLPFDLVCSCQDTANDAQNLQCPPGGCDDAKVVIKIATLLTTDKEENCEDLSVPADKLECILDKLPRSG